MKRWFANTLADHGERAALITDERTITYRELAGHVDDAVERLGRRRRLVLLAAANHPDAVIHYLGALAGGHPLILAGADNQHAIASLSDAYDPDVVVAPSRGRDGPWEIRERRASTRHDLHPDLALLLSTSGSTGSPKLVRLSHDNIESNAAAIASYLGIGDDERAITSLPISYCYGLSVLNSHLRRGAAVVLTDRSVIDPDFWSLLRRSRATSFAGVPYTFELLDRIGFAAMTLPHLRYVTQAGGRLDPATVRRYAELGRRRGWKLFVMYGQTEATARMTYLPPELAADHPESIGIPIPGGSVRLAPVPDAPAGVGELVYRGPNVMLGYAEVPRDLASGRTVDELRTGDLARRRPDGTFEIVGRRGEFAKIAGLRVDPHAIEGLLERHGLRACVVAQDDELVVFSEHEPTADPRALIRDAVALPARSVRVVRVPALERLPNGKLDRPAMQALAAAGTPSGRHRPKGDVVGALRALYASALGTSQISDRDSFASLGGDSLSYVEVTLGLEEIVGRLPDGWASMTIEQLASTATAAVEERPRRNPVGRWRSVETTVALRAIAIVLIVASHIGMLYAHGGAHVLMAVAGYNFARFRLTGAPRTDRAASQLRAVARIALPAMAWVGLAMVLFDQYELEHLLLVNALVTDQLWGNLWFIELLVYIGVSLAVLLALPAFDRAERRWPYGVALGVLAVGLVFRFELVDLGVPYTMPVLWLFAIGWVAATATRPWQRLLVAAVALASVPGYFDSWERNALILAGVLILIGVHRVVVPGALARVGGTLAGASLYIYLVHWEIWPLFEGWYGIPSLLASVGAGVGLWMAVPRAASLITSAARRASTWYPIGGAFSRRVPTA